MNAKRRGPLRPLLIVIPVVVGALSGLTYAALAAARDRRLRTYCRWNLVNIIGYVCDLYAGDCDGRFPPSLGHLYPDYISDGHVFLCPSSGKATVLRYAHLPRDSYTPAKFGDTHTDYVYVSGLRQSDPLDYILAFDDEWNHDGDGVNVLRAGGYAPSDRDWWPDIEALHEKLARQEKELAAKGRKMKVLRPAWSSWPDPPAGGHPLAGPRPWYYRPGGQSLVVGAFAALTVALALVVSTVRRGRKRGR